MGAQSMFVSSLGGDLGGKMWGMLPAWALYLLDLVFAMYTLVRHNPSTKYNLQYS